MMFRRGRLELW